MDIFLRSQEQDKLAKRLLNAVDVEAQQFVAKSSTVNQPVEYKTPNIDVIGVRLEPGNPEPRGVDLTTDGVGVKIPAVVSGDLEQATVVTYSTLRDIISEDSLKTSVDDTF